MYCVRGQPPLFDLGRPEMVGGDHQARDQALQIPFPGRWECLVEIVGVEDQLPAR
jgi:hypothetical protein